MLIRRDYQKIASQPHADTPDGYPYPPAAIDHKLTGNDVHYFIVRLGLGAVQIFDKMFDVFLRHLVACSRGRANHGATEGGHLNMAAAKTDVDGSDFEVGAHRKFRQGTPNCHSYLFYVFYRSPYNGVAGYGYFTESYDFYGFLTAVRATLAFDGNGGYFRASYIKAYANGAFFHNVERCYGSMDYSQTI